MQLRLPRNPTGDITEPHQPTSVGFPTVPRHNSVQSGTHKQSTVVYEAEEEDRIFQIVKNAKLKQPKNLTNQPIWTLLLTNYGPGVRSEYYSNSLRE